MQRTGEGRIAQIEDTRQSHHRGVQCANVRLGPSSHHVEKEALVIEGNAFSTIRNRANMFQNGPILEQL